MSDEELGLDTFVKRSVGEMPTTITDDATKKSQPLVIQQAIVSHGTSRYRSEDHECVVKFSWTSDKRPPEARLLRLGQERGVRGMAKL
jgi:hypothetical protein